MSTPAIRKIKLDPAAVAALGADTEVKFDKPLSDETIQVIRKALAKTLFGPTMRPRFKAQLFGYTSFAAIKASWAADWWQLKMKEKHG